MRTGRFRREQRGQVLVIVAIMIVALLGFTGLVTDVAWYEVNLMRIQRAADAAALAGVVYLPGNVAGAQNAALAESSKNGFANGLNGVSVTATPEALNNLILGVTVTAPVRSWFARLFGVTQFNARRNARAEFVLPVPMGRPPYTLSDDSPIASSGPLFVSSNAVDKGALYRRDSDYGGGSNGSRCADCQSSAYHNNWYRLATGLDEGPYRLQVVTSSGSNTENAINGFGIEATSSGGPTPRVYGQSRMEAFIVINNTSVFYLAQIGAAHAGKTLDIKLFDPGDISSTNFKIRIPTSTGFQYATFTWTTTGISACAPGSAASGGPTQTLVTSTSTCNYYNNQWVTISVRIPVTYTAPVSPGDPPGAGRGGWKIEYGTLGTGQDITTWEVNIRGNPVHLITP